jgi:CubicO group peptidase (beta-lactamase class C family)
MLIVALIEAVTRQPLHQVHEKLILRPLKLTQTFLPDDHSLLFPGGRRYRSGPRGGPFPLLTSVWGVYSTTADMLTFQRALVWGKVLRIRDAGIDCSRKGIASSSPSTERPSEFRAGRFSTD